MARTFKIFSYSLNIGKVASLVSVTALLAMYYCQIKVNSCCIHFI